MASLSRRLDVARAQQNERLIALLEQEAAELNRNPSLAQTVWSWLATTSRNLITALTHWSDLRVAQFEDAAGMQWWYAYNPATGQTVYTDSETDLRSWIEANYVGQ